MEKSQKKKSPNTPPSTGTKRRRSPRQHNAIVHERGRGPVGRGVKMRNIEGRGRAFSSSSELESDNDNDSSEEDEQSFAIWAVKHVRFINFTSRLILHYQ